MTRLFSTPILRVLFSAAPTGGEPVYLVVAAARADELIEALKKAQRVLPAFGVR